MFIAFSCKATKHFVLYNPSILFVVNYWSNLFILFVFRSQPYLTGVFHNRSAKPHLHHSLCPERGWWNVKHSLSHSDPSYCYCLFSPLCHMLFLLQMNRNFWGKFYYSIARKYFIFSIWYHLDTSKALIFIKPIFETELTKSLFVLRSLQAFESRLLRPNFAY